jgi:hypothetical protein
MHVRIFNEALNNTKAVAEYAMQQIQKLYAIERNCKEQNLSFDEIKIERQAESVPILTALRKWIKDEYIQTSPKGTIGKALAYSLEAGKKDALGRMVTLKPLLLLHFARKSLFYKYSINLQ